MTISVILCVFNGEEFLEQSIESALLIPEVSELVIVNDFSTDSSGEIISEFARLNDKILVINNDRNLGLATSRNIGIKSSRGEIISFLDADDWYLPHRFVNHLKSFLDNPSVMGVYSPTFLYSEISNKVVGTYGVEFDLASKFGKSECPQFYFEKIFREQLILFNNIGITVRREAFEKFGFFDDKLRLHQDTELWWRFLRESLFVGIDFHNPVGFVRIHDTNNSKNKNVKTKRLMFARYCENVGIDNLYNFEKVKLFQLILRLESQRFQNNFLRRIYYYLNFFVNRFFIRKWLLLYALRHG